MMIIAQQQEVRQVRAAQVRQTYTFRPVTIGSEAAVYVIKPPTASPQGEESGVVYTVHPHRAAPTCNCLDHMKRCVGTSRRCKHVVAALQFLADQQAAIDAEQPAFDPGEVLDAEARNARAIRDRTLLW